MRGLLIGLIGLLMLTGCGSGAGGGITTTTEQMPTTTSSTTAQSTAPSAPG